MNDNEVIYDYISNLKHIKSQQTAKDMLMRRFNLTDERAQEYLWAWAMK